jgi:hypothetical protein
MALISALITEIRTEISDDDSARFTEAQILNVIKKAIRRANRIVQRNGLQFGKKKATISTVASQNYITLSTMGTTPATSDFDVAIGLWRADTYSKIPFRTEAEWEQIISASTLAHAYLDYQNDKILLKATPSSVITLYFYYYPTVDPSAYVVGTSTPWAGRIDDIIAEYAANRLKNIDEMDVSFDTKLLTDLENQILQAYAPNSPTIIEGSGWL